MSNTLAAEDLRSIKVEPFVYPGGILFTQWASLLPPFMKTPVGSDRG